MNNKTYINPKEYETHLKSGLKRLADMETWTSKDLLDLKKLIYPVNAHITYLIGEQFLKSVSIPLEEVDFQYSNMYNNGFDIEIENYNGRRIIAEIKGNIPVEANGDKYGAQQKEGIKKDIEGLTNGKTKSKVFKNKEALKEAVKFLILLENNRNAFSTLKNNLCQCRGKKEAVYNDDNFFVVDKIENYTIDSFKTNCINVVFIEL